MRTIGRCDANSAVDKLATADVDALALFQLEQGVETGLALLGFIENTAPVEGNIGGTSETHSGAVFSSVSAEGVAANVYELRVFNQQIPVFTRVNGVAVKSDAVAAGKVHIVFLTANDVGADCEESRRSGCIAIFLDANVCAAG